MKKALFLLFPLMISACAHSGWSEEEVKTVDYNCGNQKISVTYMSDAVWIANINGINNVLTPASSDSEKYENLATQVVFRETEDGGSLKIGGKSYPSCLPYSQKIADLAYDEAHSS